MFKNKTFIGVIPARGQSKRLPHKNILNLCGKPLIAWTIEAGLKSKYLDEVVVSTDDKEIMKVAEKYGAQVPFQRPLALAADTTPMSEVIFHLLSFYYSKKQKQYNYIVLLQPTSPLRDANDIDNAIEYMDMKKADAILAVTEMAHSPLWANTLPKDLSMDTFIHDKVKDKQSQDLPKYYQLNGAIYICDIKRFKDEKSFLLNKNTYAYIMEQEKSIDIDTELDFYITEYLLKKRNRI